MTKRMQKYLKEWRANRLVCDIILFRRDQCGIGKSYQLTAKATPHLKAPERVKQDLKAIKQGLGRIKRNEK